MSIRVKVDADMCGGFANCVMTAPSVFRLDEETEQASVVAGHPTPGEEDAARGAAADCPVRAILIENG